jgi:predicted dienelactone hydrolase
MRCWIADRAGIARIVALATWVAAGAVAAPMAAAAYDPLALEGASAPLVSDTSIRDGSREIPLRLYLPAVLAAPAPIVLFSHGLGGSREGNAYCGRHWAARGYVAVFLQHPGSDTSVWQGLPRAQRLWAMRRAASAKNFTRRVADVKAVLDALGDWNAAGAQHELSGKLDLGHVGMSGHSFGAVTTQAVSGQQAPLVGGRFNDPRIRAALAMSPSMPRRGSVDDAFGAVKIPWLLMTGTRDTAPIGGQTVASRLAVFPSLRRGDKYELVLDGAEHSAFSDRALPGDREPRNPNHHRAILALSTAFWDAYLREDAAARAWLHGDGARSVLEAKDRWRMK